MAACNDPVGDFWTQVVENTGADAEDNGPDFDPSQVEFGGGATHSVIDEVLGCRLAADSRHTAVRNLLEQPKAALSLPVTAGSRVAFVANLDSVLSYSDVPHPACEGSVVTVKTAFGPATSQDGRVFVMWDDGHFRSIRAEHLKPGSPRKTANNFRMVVADLGDISSMFITAGGGDELVHKATKDLWAVKKEGGQYVIERLFDDTGKPLKV